MITIGSFNIQNYKGNNEKKKPERMARIIANENFDLMALQEILDEDAVRRIADHLGLGWSFAWAKPGIGNEAKGYAFLWNSRKIVPIQEPYIYSEAAGSLTRPPFVGIFACGCFRVQLINTQIFSQGHKTCNKEPIKQKEYKMLCGPIYRSLDNAAREEFVPSYTIVLGDFNMFPEWCDECHLELDFRRECEGRDIVCGQRELTSITQDGGGYRYSIDHFSYDQIRFASHGIKISRVDSLGDLHSFREEISDHVPVKMEVTFR